MDDWDTNHRRMLTLVLTGTVSPMLAGCSDDSSQPTEEGDEETDNQSPADQVENSEQQAAEEPPARSSAEMPPAYRIDFRNTGETQHPLFEYTATTEDDEAYGTDDPAVRELDLDALDQWYENNWENTAWTELEQFMDDPTTKFPEQEEAARESVEEMRAARSYEQFRDPFTNLFFSFVSKSDDFDGPISSEADIYLPTVQEAVDRYNDNFDIHAWDFQTEGLSEGHRHGLGQVYDRTNDEMWVFETVDSPRTARDTDLQEAVNGQRLGETPYLQPGTHTYEEGHKHPLRFKDIYENPEEAAPQEMGGFNRAKGRAHDFIIRMAGGPGSGRVGMTNKLIVDTLDNLTGGPGFDQAYEVAKVAEWCRTEEQNYVLSGTVEKPEIFEIDNDLTDKFLEDEAGLFDEFGLVVDEYTSGNYQSWSEAAEAVNR